MTQIANSWQISMQNSVTCSQELLQILELDLAAFKTPRFSCKVPHEFIAKMQKGEPNDPLLRQVLPEISELINAPGFQSKPILEQKFSPIPGLVHKYHNRALLTITGACAVHCRYCFRQNTNYQASNPNKHKERILEYLINSPNINEIILSGGDPLSISDQKLIEWIQLLEQAPNLVRLRIHTRLPVIIPHRITDALVNCLKDSRLVCSIVMHTNHPNELDKNTQSYWQKLNSANIILLNQSVLLKGINDNVAILQQLSQKLIEHKVLPYYLHQLDQVQGSHHFLVEIAQGKRLIQDLAKLESGYLIPKYVQDLNGFAKAIL